MKRFVLKKSTRPDWWVLTDTEKKIVLQFEQHRFNETQNVSFLDDEPIDPKELARIMRKFGDWMYKNAYYIGMPLDDTRAFCSHIIATAMREEGFDVEMLAEKSGFRERNIEKILNGEFALKVNDLVRILSAMGKRIVIK